MRWDASDIALFYESRLGQAVKRAIMAQLKEPLSEANNADAQVFGIGYVAPYLDSESRNHNLLMPSGLGLKHWPEIGARRTVQIDSHALPLPDQSADLILVMHTLETATHIPRLLTESWRALKSNGRMIVVVPNRTGFWIRSEKTPFGMGRVFSMSQIRELLKEAEFVIDRTKRALFFPPYEAALPIARGCDLIGSRFLPALAGVNIIEATKQVYAVTPRGSRQTSSIFTPPTPAVGAR